MQHRVSFIRSDFTQNPVAHERKVVVIEFNKITDVNAAQFELLIWKRLFELPGTSPKGRFSSWMESSRISYKE